MRRTLHPRLVRAARALLELSQEELATSAGIGLATLKRFESGQATRIGTERSVQSALEGYGIIVINAGTVMDGHSLAAGVALRSDGSAAEADAPSQAPSGKARKRVRSV